MSLRRAGKQEDVPCLESIRSTPVLVATDLAAASEFYHGKLGLLIDRRGRERHRVPVRRRHPPGRDRRAAPLEPPTRQTKAAWQVSDIRAEVAELRARGIKVEDYDTPGTERPKTASPTSAPAGRRGSSTQAANALGILQTKGGVAEVTSRAC